MINLSFQEAANLVEFLDDTEVTAFCLKGARRRSDYAEGKASL
jgi:hypothetical protein